MAKSQDARKETKKKPAKTLKEKRAEKRDKKNSKSDYWHSLRGIGPWDLIAWSFNTRCWQTRLLFSFPSNICPWNAATFSKILLRQRTRYRLWYLPPAGATGPSIIQQRLPPACLILNWANYRLTISARNWKMGHWLRAVWSNCTSAGSGRSISRASL